MSVVRSQVRAVAARSVVLAAWLVAGCASAPASDSGVPIGVGPVKLRLGGPGEAYRAFPLPPDAATRGDCDPIAPDESVAYRALAVESRYVREIALRLPPTLRPVDSPNEGPPVSESLGGILVANLFEPAWGGSRRGRDVTVWVGPERGLPGVGAPVLAEQIAYAECVSPGPVPGARAVTFVLANGADTVALLSASWPLGSGRYVQIVAQSPDAAGLIDLRRALRDARTDARAASR